MNFMLERTGHTTFKKTQSLMMPCRARSAMLHVR